MSVAWRCFDAVFAPFRTRALAQTLIARPALRPPGPIAFVANHTSWWDGFLLRELQRSLAPDATPYTVMLERELRRRPFLRTLGAIGIEPGSTASLRTAIRRLESARERHGDRFCLFYFPQGRIWPSYRRPLGFVAGCSRVLARVAPLSVVPVALHLEPLNRLSPTACVRAGAPVAVADRASAPSEAELERRVTELLDRTLALAGASGEGLPEVWT